MKNDEPKLTPQQKYYQKNKERIIQKAKEYYETNKETINEKTKEYHKEYYKANKDKIIEYTKTNKDKLIQYSKDWNANNKERKNKNNIAYRKKRLENDPVFKMKHNIRSLISSSFRKKTTNKPSKSEIILGCSFDKFKEHIESLWESWMNWDNYGNPKDGIYEPNKTWDFDHIIPNKEGSTIDEIIALNHYTNIQPLCSHYNRFVKSDKNNLPNK